MGKGSYIINNIEIRKINKCKNWIDFEFFIDDIRLSEHLSKNKNVLLPDYVEPFDDLCPAWTKELDYFGDVRFVWKLLEQEKTVLPIYMCPDDLDFSCIVIVVEVEKTKDFVYWNRFGLVNHKDYDFSKEIEHGILDIASYTDEDWQRYGDNIALSEVHSKEWSQWICDNWDEELFRRRMNYTLPSYLNSKNIIWFAAMDWAFNRDQYEKMLNYYWDQETLDELSNYSSKLMKFDDCVKLIEKLTRNGCIHLAEHQKAFGEVLLHIYAAEEIGTPLFELLQQKSESKYIAIYSKAVELMWKYGDESVKNVVDVTLLERLSDDLDVWNGFGKHVSKEFKDYINNDLLSWNIAMCGVSPI